MPPTISGDFFQMPTLAPVGFQKVVGESHNQAAIAAAFARYDCRYVMAQLVPEPTNAYDPDAIMVTIDGAKVGYVPRDEMHGYHTVIGTLHSAGTPIAVRAKLTGGDSGRHWGVVLLCTAELFKPSLGMLYGDRYVEPDVDSARAGEVAAHLRVGPEYPAVLRVIDGDEDTAVEVWVGDLLVGTLDEEDAEDLIEGIVELESRSIPASTAIEVYVDGSGRNGYSVMLPEDREMWDEVSFGNFAPSEAETAPPQPAQVTVTPASWHPDPMGRFQYRWWDGAAWTAHVSTNGQVFADPTH